MFLEIKNTLARDQGFYQCEITFANKTLTSGAKLSVKAGRVVPIVVQTKLRKNDVTSLIPRGEENEAATTGDGTHDIKEIIHVKRRVANGTCSRYSGDVCSLYLGQTVVFERDLQPMSILNKRLESVINILKETERLSKRFVFKNH